MRILQVNKFYDPRGGAERILFDLEDGLRERGHELAVFATADPRNRPTPWARHFPPARDYDQPTPGQRVSQAVGVLHDREAAAALEGLLDEFAPDVAHLHNIYHQLSPSVLGPLRRRGIPVVMTLHDYKLSCPTYTHFRDGAPCELCLGRTLAWPVARHRCSRGSLAESALLAVESSWHRWRRSYERGVDLFLAPSEFLRGLVLRHGLPAARVVHLPNAPRALPGPAPAGERDPRPTVLYAGRLTAEKGIAMLVEAARAQPSVQLRVAGDGPLLDELRARPLPNVEWLGRVGAERLAAERARAWACALPSVWYENMPLSLLEAWASARPVLASDRGGHRELLESGVGGELLPAGDVAAWSAALAALGGRADALAAQGEAGRARVEAEFSFGRFLDRHEEIYRQLVARGAA